MPTSLLKTSTPTSSATPPLSPVPTSSPIPKATPYTQTFAASVCPTASSNTATITKGQSNVGPRCISAFADQHLATDNSYLNSSGTAVFAGKTTAIPAHKVVTISGTFGSYFETGVHKLYLDYFNGVEIEIWYE